MPIAIGIAVALSAAINVNAATVAQAMAPTQTVRNQVETYFADTPVLVDIARCESHFRQFNTDGGVYRGKINRYDVGVMQINELYHKAEATALGLDLTDLADNLAFAKQLYDKEGTKPWASSGACWGKTQAAKDLLAINIK